MKKKAAKPNKNFFEKFSLAVSKATGSTAAFSIALTSVIIWAVTGPMFHYSETWHLVINRHNHYYFFNGISYTKGSK